MAIKQISVFVENKPGRLADITGFLADGGSVLFQLPIQRISAF